MKNKKGVSAVVITVSLILIAVVAVGIIASFVMPMIKTQLGKAQACLALRDHFKVLIESSGTCYTDTGVNLSIQRGFEKEEAKGFAITVHSKTGEAVSDTISSGDIPDKGGAKVYSFDITGGVERVTISTILPNDEVCDAAEYTGIRPC